MDSLTTIGELQEMGLMNARKLLSKWHIVDELNDWVETVTEKQIPWTTTHKWNESRVEYRFHPSSFTEPCDFKMFLDLVGGEQAKKVTKQQAIFDMGTVIHLLMEYYQGTRALYHGYTYDAEAKLWKGSVVADKYMLCGSADGVCEREIPGPHGPVKIRCVFEYKSANDNQFCGLGNKPKTDAVKQTHGYMVSGDIPFTVILYINKDNSLKRAFVNFYSDKIWTPIGDRLLRLIDLANDMKEPLKAEGKGCYRCRYFGECRPTTFYKARRTSRSVSMPEW